MKNEKMLYNKFQLAQMKIEKGDSKIAFLSQLLHTENVNRDKSLLSMINIMIRKIVESVAKVGVGGVLAVATLPFVAIHEVHNFFSKTAREIDTRREQNERERYEKAGKPYPETFSDYFYQNSEEYAKQESFILKKLGIDDSRLYSAELQEQYRVLESLCNHLYSGQELKDILSTIDLSDNGNFIVDGKEMAMIKGNEQIKEFLKHGRAYTIEHPEYIPRDYKVFETQKLEGTPYMFVDAANPLVEDFLYKEEPKPDEEIIQNKEEKSAELDKEAVKRVEDVLMQHKLSRPEKVHFRKVLWNQVMDVSIKDIVKMVKKDAPDLLKELGVLISVSTKKENNHLIAKDDYCFYVKVPAMKKETIIAVPKDADFRFSKGEGLLINMNMAAKYPIVDKETLNPTGREFSCADLIINDKFAPTDIRRMRNSDFKGEIISIRGIDYGIDRTDPEHLKATVIRSTTDRFIVDIENTVKVDDIDVPVVAIGKNAFFGNKFTHRVTLPENIAEIGSEAFAGCEKLLSVTSKNEKGVKVDSTAFNDCNTDNLELKGLETKDISDAKEEEQQDIHNDTHDVGLDREIIKDAERKDTSERTERHSEPVIEEKYAAEEAPYMSTQSIYDMFGDMGH